jgi:hypothetical protein
MGCGRAGPRALLGGIGLAGVRIPWVVLATSATGCVGYVMGWSDAEVDRLRRIVAELEAKNATLVEEVIELRSALKRARDSSLEDGRAVDGQTSSRSGSTSGGVPEERADEAGLPTSTRTVEPRVQSSRGAGDTAEPIVTESSRCRD